MKCFERLAMVQPDDWVAELLGCFEDEHILARKGSAVRLAPAHALRIDPEDWARSAEVAGQFGCRWVALWVDDSGEGTLPVLAAYEFQGDYLVPLVISVPVGD